MLRLSAIASLLDAIVQAGGGKEEEGAHTALLTLYNTAELYAYAARPAPGASSSRSAGLMASDIDTPLDGEDRARILSAIAVAAWRDQMQPSVPPTPVANRATPRKQDLSSPEVRTHNARRFHSSHRRDASTSTDTPGRMPNGAGALRFHGHDGSGMSEVEKHSPALESETPGEAETLPLLLENEVSAFFLLTSVRPHACCARFDFGAGQCDRIVPISPIPAFDAYAARP